MTSALPPQSTDVLLRLGATGAGVRDLQHRLAALGHDPAPDTAGSFGAETERAVRAFQESRGLQVDGICGQQTWSALIEAGYRLGDRLLYQRRPMLRGDDVAELQRQLCSLGFDTGRVDGIFGPNSEQALVEFQRNSGLTTDGVCGRDTLATLHRLGDRTNGTATVAELHQREELRERAAQDLEGRVVVLGEDGGLAILVDNVARELREVRARPLVVGQPDHRDHAARANQVEADAYLGFAPIDEPGAVISYFGSPAFTSVGGIHLATLLADELRTEGWEPVTTQGMRLPILRETRMPAVYCQLGSPALVVSRLAELSAAVVRAVQTWTKAPVAPPAEG